MGIILDPAQPVSYTPREGGPTFLLRPPTVADRIKYQHALRAQGAQFHPNLVLMELARKALDRLLPAADNPETHAESLAQINDYCDTLKTAIAERQAERTEVTDKAFADAIAFPDNLTILIEALHRGDLALGTALADNAVYWSWAGDTAARLFLVGWEGLGKFKRGLSGPTEASMRQIDPNDLAMIGIHVEQLMRPDEDRIKNLDSPPSGHSGETKSSSAGKTTRRNGHSQDATVTA